MSNSDNRELLTVDQVATVLKVPKATLYQWSYQGEGPPVVRSGGTCDTQVIFSTPGSPVA